MNDRKAKITIVITVYNKEPYIRQCLKSVLNQTDTNYKLIIVDDESTDKSYSICKSTCLHLNCKIVSQPHGGSASARNKGIELSDTDYIFFIDGDDYIAPNTIDILNKMIENSPELIVFGINHALKSGNMIYNTKLPNRLYTSKKDIKENLVVLWESNLMCSSCNKLFSLKKMKENNIFFQNKDFGEDLTFVCDYTRHCSSIIVIDECLYTYRQHILDSQSQKIREDFFEIRRDEYFELYQYFSDMNCLDNRAIEFISRRYVERIIGCIENEASPRNCKSLKLRLKKTSQMVFDSTVQKSIRCSKLKSRKMKVLSWLIKHNMPYTLFVLGIGISIVKNGFPKLFMILKMHR